MGFLNSLFGGSPKADNTPAQQTQSAADQAALARTQLLETEGGAAGVELDSSEVRRNPNTILGN